MDKPDSAAVASPTARLTDGTADWATVGLAKGSWHSYTAAFTVNGWDHQAPDGGNHGAITLGFGFW